jgi:hypothetical protein
MDSGTEQGNPDDEQVLAWLEEYRDLSLEVLEANREDAEGAVRGLVSLHVDWTEGDPERARAVAAGRARLASGPLGEKLKESNRILFGALRQWTRSAHEAGEIATDSVPLLHALVFSPTQELARLNLAGLLDRPLGEYREDLADAVWSAVRSRPTNS